MKIKLGPIEIEQESVSDEILLNEFKKSKKDVEEYLEEKSKFFDLTLKNIIGGKTVKMIKDFVFTIIGGIAFIGWSVYVFYISKDAFVWNEMDLGTIIYIFLQALLIIFICLLPVLLISGFLQIVNAISSHKEKTFIECTTDSPI